MLSVFEFIEREQISIDAKYMKLFWNAFNEDPCWIYLSRDMIFNHIIPGGISSNDKKMCRFLTRYLYKFTKGVDYIEVDRNHKLVKNHIDTVYTPGKRHQQHKKFRLLTHECFKIILAKRNKQALKYFIQIERLCMMYAKYQAEFYKDECDTFKKKMLKCLKCNSIKQCSRLSRIDEIEKQIYEKNKIGCVYFIQDEMNNTKIGFCYNLPERLTTLQVGNSQQLTVIKTVFGAN